MYSGNTKKTLEVFYTLTTDTERRAFVQGIARTYRSLSDKFAEVAAAHDDNSGIRISLLAKEFEILAIESEKFLNELTARYASEDETKEPVEELKPSKATGSSGALHDLQDIFKKYGKKDASKN